ncbi:MAG: tyrosine-type recombinase/integrase [Romboutsia timonensis]|uniref:tyrosine-type recombinase/integrase n=1 Tax=Romboutsia timonensis TaxID=1776391 RepID=UPI002A74ACA7|nr:tyrosine-type recombinase/integrase [Romboutsia timonensis]MDY2881939.1 tyrosine-type recombinase/integrase [Romboutsia timonensis]
MSQQKIKKKKNKKTINGIEYYYKKATIGKDPITGKAIRKDFYGETATEVREKISQYKALHREHLNPDNKDTFGTLIEYWLKNVKFVSGIKNSTKERYWGLYNNYINDIHSFLKLNKIEVNSLLKPKLNIKDIPLIKLNIAHIQEYYNTLFSIGISSNTISFINKLIKPFIKYAYVYDKISKDFGEGLEIPKISRSTIDEDDNYVEVFTRDERDKFLKAIEGDPEELLYKVALSMGLRLGELLGLKWSCIDFNESTLKVKYSARREKDIKSGISFLTITTLKTSSSYSTLPIPDNLLKELIQYKSKQDIHKKVASNMYDDNDLVFCTPFGKIIDQSNLRKRYKKILLKNNIKYKKFHSLRHTCASILFEDGKNIVEVKNLLRHKNIATTIDIYTHLSKEYKYNLISNFTI